MFLFAAAVVLCLMGVFWDKTATPYARKNFARAAVVFAAAFAIGTFM